jgi:hypothetical protein
MKQFLRKEPKFGETAEEISWTSNVKRDAKIISRDRVKSVGQ